MLTAAPELRFSGVRAFRAIDEVDAAAWDAIVPPDALQLRHAFVRACEHAGVADAVYRHLMVYRAGELVGVASVFRMDVPLELLCPPALRALVRGVRRLWPTFLRPTLLLCGLPVSAGRPCIAFRSPDDAPYVLRVLAAHLERTAAELGARLLCCKEFSPAEAAHMDGLLARGWFRAHSLPTFRLALPWRTPAAYRAALRAGYRRQLRTTARAGGLAGLTVRTTRPNDADWQRFFPLYEQVMARAPHQLERLNLAFFRNLGAYLPGHVRMVLVERGEALVAAAVLLESGQLTTFFMAGIDYATAGEGEAYPNLVAAVVSEAIAAGTGLLELGQTSDALKTRLGAVPEPRWLYFRHRGRVAHALFRLAAPLLFPPTHVPERRVFRSDRLQQSRAVIQEVT